MLRKNNLSKRILEEGFYGFEVETIISEYALVLSESDIDELFKFCKLNNIRNIFYSFTYNDIEDFLIDEDKQEEIEPEKYRLIKKEIKEHNDKLKVIDFKRPIKLCIFCIYENKYIAVKLEDNWHLEEGIFEADEMIDLFLDNHWEVIIDIEAAEEEKMETLKEQLREYMLKDDKFKVCTNKGLREIYWNELYKNKEMKQYFEPFIYDRKIATRALNMFVDSVWIECKRLIK